MCKGSGCTLYGFEYNDIVLSLGRYVYAKKLEISSSGKAWIPIVNEADTFVICADIGDLITPSASDAPYVSTKCNSMPENMNFLVATVQ